VITASTGGLTSSSNAQVTALSCVFRAGRAGSKTDHSSVLYNVDVVTGEITHGAVNSYWYHVLHRAFQASKEGVYSSSSLFLNWGKGGGFSYAKGGVAVHPDGIDGSGRVTRVVNEKTGKAKTESNELRMVGKKFSLELL